MKITLSTVLLIAVSSFFISSQLIAAPAATEKKSTTVNLNSGIWLGHLKLDSKQLSSIKTAFEKALNSPVDAEQQCGKVRLDCVVRAAREWKVDGDTYREVVINIHTVGHASRAVGQSQGKWPTIAIK